MSIEFCLLEISECYFGTTEVGRSAAEQEVNQSCIKDGIGKTSNELVFLLLRIDERKVDC